MQLYIPPPDPMVQMLRLLSHAGKIAEAQGFVFTASARIDSKVPGEYVVWTYGKGAQTEPS